MGLTRWLDRFESDVIFMGIMLKNIDDVKYHSYYYIYKYIIENVRCNLINCDFEKFIGCLVYEFELRFVSLNNDFN